MRVPLSDDWSLVPSLLVKAVRPAPLSVDLNAKLKYQDLLWFGTPWRAFNSAVAMVGLSYEQYTLGYYYDAGLSELAGTMPGGPICFCWNGTRTYWLPAMCGWSESGWLREARHLPTFLGWCR